MMLNPVITEFYRAPPKFKAVPGLHVLQHATSGLEKCGVLSLLGSPAQCITLRRRTIRAGG